MEVGGANKQPSCSTRDAEPGLGWDNDKAKDDDTQQPGVSSKTNSDTGSVFHKPKPKARDHSKGGRPRSSKNSINSKQQRGQKSSYSYRADIVGPESIEEKWSFQEKIKLLEGMKRYNEQSDIISEWIETKTPDEVEEMICALKTQWRVFQPKSSATNKLIAGHEAPLEKWLSLCHDVTFYEKADLSELVPMVFGLIARNEEFEATETPALDWKRIYNYLAHLLNGATPLPSLSNVESAIVLDLMDNLGGSLRDLETDQPRQLLDFKFHLLRTFRNSSLGMDTQQMNRLRLSQALGNALWVPNSSCHGTSEEDTSNGETSELEEGNDKRPVPNNSAKDQKSTTRKVQPSTTKRHSTAQNSQFTSTSRDATVSTVDIPDSSVSDNHVHSEPGPSSSSEQHQNDLRKNSESSFPKGPLGTELTPSTSSESQNSTTKTSRTKTPKGDGRPAKRRAGPDGDNDDDYPPVVRAEVCAFFEPTQTDVLERMAKLAGDTPPVEFSIPNFKKPKLFTLNPLCIPPSVLPLRKKKRRKGEDAEEETGTFE